MRWTLKALSLLLTYPDAELREKLPGLIAALETDAALARPHREALLALAGEIAAADGLDAEEAYVDVFDRGRATSLNLFEHLHGDSRERGPAMVDLKLTYERAGFRLSAKQLPDYLPVLLEFLSTREAGEVRETLADCAHLVRGLGESLRGRESPYAAVPAAILALAGEPGLGKGPTPVREPEKSLDEEWRDAEVIFGPAAACGNEAPATSVVRFAPRAS
mgnify:CR=1 FL=1|jgi:nitrate reductase delta subunit